MTQIITLKRGSIELPSGMKLQFEEAEIGMGGGITVRAAAERLEPPAIKVEKVKAKGKAASSGTGNAKDYTRDVVEILKKNPDGITSAEVFEALKERGWKTDRQKLDNKLCNMKKSEEVERSDDRKYTLSDSYFEEPKTKKLKLND